MGREAQRATRQRTEEHIENLEKQIADASTELIVTKQWNEKLQRENASLRSRLGIVEGGGALLTCSL